MAVLPPVKLLSFSFCKSKQRECTWKHFRYEINTFIKAAMRQCVISDWSELQNELLTPGWKLGGIISGGRSRMELGRRGWAGRWEEGMKIRKARDAIRSGSSSPGVSWSLLSFRKLLWLKVWIYLTQNWEWRKKRCSCAWAVMARETVVCFVPVAPEQFQHETTKFWAGVVTLVLFLVKSCHFWGSHFQRGKKIQCRHKSLELNICLNCF